MEQFQMIMSREYEPQELKKICKSAHAFWFYKSVIQMISVNQDSKLKRTVKKRAISLMYRFVFSISWKNFWFQRGIGLFCDLSGIFKGG